MIEGLQIRTLLPHLLIFCGFFIFFDSNSSFAQKQLETIALKKEESELPVNVLKGYAESILFRKIALDTIVFDWSLLPYIKAEHRALITDEIKSGVNVKVSIKDLKMTEALHDKDNFYFQFEFSKPKTKVIKLNEDLVKISLLEGKYKPDFVAGISILNFLLTYEQLVTPLQMKKKWKEILPFHSYDAIFLNSEPSFEVSQYSNKKFLPKQLSSNLEEAFLLFDFAPFNIQACTNLLAVLPNSLEKLLRSLRAQCEIIERSQIEANLDEIKRNSVNSIEKSGKNNDQNATF